MVQEKKPGIRVTEDCHFTPENMALLQRDFDLSPYPNIVNGLIIPRNNLIPHTWDYQNLRVLATPTTSIDHISEDYKKKYDILSLENDPILQQITSTAEHTLGLIMAVHRSIPASSAAAQAHYAKEPEWDRYKWPAPRMLSQMTLGILGYGRVGKHLQGMIDGLFKDMVTVDTYCIGQYLQTFLREIDILCITASPSKVLLHIGYPELCLLPHNAIVINTSRSEFLDIHAAVSLVKTEHLWGLGLDTIPYENDPQQRNKLLTSIRHPRIVITPHIAGSTRDAWDMTQKALIKKLVEYFKNEEES